MVAAGLFFLYLCENQLFKGRIIFPQVENKNLSLFGANIRFDSFVRPFWFWVSVDDAYTHCKGWFVFSQFVRENANQLKVHHVSTIRIQKSLFLGANLRFDSLMRLFGLGFLFLVWWCLLDNAGLFFLNSREKTQTSCAKVHHFSTIWKQKSLFLAQIWGSIPWCIFWVWLDAVFIYVVCFSTYAAKSKPPEKCFAQRIGNRTKILVNEYPHFFCFCLYFAQ